MQGLFKISNYELLREVKNNDDTTKDFAVIRIRAKKLLSEKDSSFIAVPERGLMGEIMQANNKFVGEGITEEDAVNDCINKIGEHSFSDVFD